MLKDDMVRQGNWLFRRRFFLPLMLLPAALAVFPNSGWMTQSFGEPFEEAYDYLCLAIACAGLVIRIAAAGFAPAGIPGRNTRNAKALDNKALDTNTLDTKTLNTTGLYSQMRHPLHFANFLILIAFVLLFKSLVFTVFAAMAYFFYFERVMLAEENFLERLHGQRFRNWAARTPAFLPRLSGWVAPSLPFSWRAALAREFPTVFLIASVFFLVEALADTLIEGQPLNEWLHREPFWIWLLLSGAAATLGPQSAAMDRLSHLSAGNPRMTWTGIGSGLKPWLKRFGVLAAAFLAAQMALRLFLAARMGSGFVDGPADLVRPFVVGLWFDLSVLLIALLPGTLYWALLPASWRGGKFDRAITYAGAAFVVFLIGFTMIGEVLFWNEFSTRFNFIAVDYLVYTREVVGNIRESYPVGTLLAALALVALAFTFLLRKPLRARPDALSYPGRLGIFAALFATAFVVNDVSTSRWTEASTNPYANELSANGYYSLVRAFFHNEIDYRRFYKVEDDRIVNARIRRMLAAPGVRFVTDMPGDVTRDINTGHKPLRKNVVLVTIESLSANFMQHFGDNLGLTPHLDALADQSVFFTNMLATGTRTVRGLEAVSLSVPPTPGQSILRRPGNEKLFSIGSVLRDHGYSATFLYGGDGSFDNMNQFFGDNGYRVIDRSALASSEITFSNAWGVSDEDLFARAVKEADRSHENGEPFFQHIMTVSNHRPFTYPEGRIVPPHSGPVGLGDRTLAKYVERTREGGVKYTDYAIGKFIEQARTRPWFNDTLFVFVADHTASSAGKIEVDPTAYHIPAIFYGPGFLAPRRIDRLVSQIDIAPSILGALRMSYRSRFIGQDQLAGEGPARAFISNYQKVALVRGDEIALLGTRRDVKGFRDGHPVDPSELDPELVPDAIAYYQHASGWHERFSGTNSVMPGGPDD